MCCTQAVVDAAPQLSFRPIGQVVLKGKTEAVGLYSPVDAHTAASADYTDYLQAYDWATSGSPQALPAMQALAARCPDDGLVGFHLQRLEQGMVGTRIVMEDK